MTIRFFDDVQEAIDDIHSRRREADSAVLRWQWELLKAGTYAIRIADGLLIYTEIVEELKAPHLRGFVFGKHYSVLCPDGESGDAHRCAFLAVITKEMFEAAREQGWRTWTGFEG